MMYHPSPITQAWMVYRSQMIDRPASHPEVSHANTHTHTHTHTHPHTELMQIMIVNNACPSKNHFTYLCIHTHARTHAHTFTPRWHYRIKARGNQRM